MQPITKRIDLMIAGLAAALLAAGCLGEGPIRGQAAKPVGDPVALGETEASAGGADEETNGSGERVANRKQPDPRDGERLRALGYLDGGPSAESYAYPGVAQKALEFSRQRMPSRPAPAGGAYAGHHIYIPPPQIPSREAYEAVEEEGFVAVADQPLSTFSTDVDTASYSNVRRFLTSGSLPPAGAVRIEELINYFDYNYGRGRSEHPFHVAVELTRAPWNPEHHLMMVGLEAEAIDDDEVPPRNLVFLLDVSGSMQPENKLGLVKQGLRSLVSGLRPQDYVSIVVYAGASGLVLEPTSGNNKERIVQALDRLSAGGSTNGGDGIRLAYDTARKHFADGSINRVILATDGDFNVGTTNQSDLVKLIEKERESGVFLTVLGVGQGNLQDATMEKLADHGNGNYAYLDSRAEARKVLVEEAGATLHTVAKDVKIQIEFNPNKVSAYRLIGYENRRLQAKDFNDDKKDAGEIGAGHTVTALYEIVPAGVTPPGPSVDPLRYQKPAETRKGSNTRELATVKLRYKEPEGTRSKLLTRHIVAGPVRIEEASENIRFASAVAVFGMILGDSGERGKASFDMAQDLAKTALGNDPEGYRAEFVRLVALARGAAGG